MRILFDQGTPVPLRAALPKHQVETAFERGWSELQNGELLDAAEREGFDLIITTDQNLRYQQDVGARTVAILVLMTTAWPRLRTRLSAIQLAVDGASPGDYIELPI